MADAPVSLEPRKTGPGPKVLFLIGKLIDGGAERVFVNYVRHAQSVKPVVVLREPEGRMYSKLPEGCPIEFVDREVSAESTIRPGKSFLVWLRNTHVGHYLGIVHRVFQTFVFSWRLVSIADRNGTTVVSCFLMETHLIGLLAKRLFRKDLKILLNVHEHISGSVLHSYPTGLERLALRFVMRHLYPGADQIIVVSDSMKTDLVEHYQLDPDKIFVAHNPIDITEVRSLAYAEDTPFIRASNPEEVVLVFLGRLVHLKGVHHLVEAIGHLKGRLPVRALLIGEGEEYCSLHSQCRELGVLGNVEFLGWLDNPWQVLVSADLLVQPSLTEAAPLALIEAMALGIPVVASDCSPGIRELLDNGQYGRLVPAGNSKALAVAIEEVMESASLRQKYSRLGKNRVKDFSLKNTVPAYERILQKALTG